MKLSKKALLLLQAIFADNSGIQVPIGVANEVIEIRKWVEEELKEQEEFKNEEKGLKK